MVEIEFGGQPDPVLVLEQKLSLSGVSFYLSFVGVATVCSFFGTFCVAIRRIFLTLLLV